MKQNMFGQDIPKTYEAGGEKFPDRQDYENYCVQKGYVQNPDEIWESDHAVLMIQRHWHHTGQNGCVFAQSIAYKQDDIGWESLMLRDLSESLFEDINNRIIDSINNPNNEVLSLMFPRIKTEEEVAFVISKLLALPTVNLGFQQEHGEYTSFGLRTPLVDGQVLSWLVSFAPLDYLPSTRQAPVFEVAIRTKTKGDNLFYRLNANPEEAHLADVPLGYNDKTMERLWDATYTKTRKILGGNEARKNNPFASAKVTLALPTKLCNF